MKIQTNNNNGKTGSKYIFLILKKCDILVLIFMKSHTCSLEYNKKLWSPPQMILVTVYCFDSN